MDPPPAPAPPTGPPPPVQSHPIAPPATNQPPPVWGPDRETQRETGITARPAFTDLLNAEIGADLHSLLFLLSHVATPQDWTPAFLASLHEYLQLAEFLDPMMAWATFNVVFEKAILTCNLPLVRTCLAEHRWRLCKETEREALVLLAVQARRLCRTILPLLAADGRFGQVFLGSIVSTTVTGYCHELGINSDVLPTVLAIPSVDPWMVWQKALEVSVDSMVEVRKIWQARESPLFDPEWAWRRCVAADKDWRARRGETWSDCQQQKAVEFPQPCAKLLTDLPTDIQYMLCLLLGPQSVGRIRSTCRTLTSFPAHQYASRQLHSACFQSATAPGRQWDSRRFQSLLTNALSLGHRSNMSYEDHVGRVLVESARHLTDLGFSLHLLAQLDNPTRRTTAAVYLTWALHTLLTSAHSPTPATSVLLCHLLMHPHLPLEAWSLVTSHYDAAATILANEPHPRLFPVDTNQKCIKRLLLHLVRTRAFPSSDWSLLATMFPGLSGAPIAHQPWPRVPALETRLMLALATQTNSPATLNDLVLDVPSELAHPRTIKSLIRLYAVCAPVCSPAFVAHVLERTKEGVETTCLAVLCAVPSSQHMSTQECTRRMAVVDVLLEDLGSAEHIRNELCLIKRCGANVGANKWVVWRGMWWWLKLASNGDKGWQEMRTWIKQELDEAQRGEVVVEEHVVVWLTELQELWEQKKGWNIRVWSNRRFLCV